MADFLSVQRISTSDKRRRRAGLVGAGLGLVVLAVAAGGLALRQMMRSGEEAGAEGLIGH